MNVPIFDLPGRYAAALRRHVDRGGEAALQQAYEIGHQAVRADLGLLAMVDAHHAALAALLQHAAGPAESLHIVGRAAEFLREAISPFEMIGRGFRETNEQLRQLTGELEQRVADRTAELQGALRARDETLAVVSHDLRNPVSTIAMSASLLLELPLPEERRTEQIRAIKRAAERMNRLIQDLLDIARIEAGRLTVEPERQELGPILEETREMLAPLAAEKGVRFEVEAPADVPAVAADHDRLLQVFSNILGNAIKFTGEGGEVRLHVEPSGDMVSFAVGDTGPGIPPEQLPHIFDRFWQGDRDFRRGAGLGLAIARWIVEAHGGTIGVESTEGVGSTFTFTIPVAGSAQEHGAAGDDGEAGDGAVPARPASDGGRRRGTTAPRRAGEAPPGRGAA